MRIANLFTWMVVVSLLCAAPALAQVPTTGFTEDFSSYTAPTLSYPWADFNTGTSPVTGGATVVAAGDNPDPLGSSQVVQFNSTGNGQGEPVMWFNNPLNATGQIVNITFTVRGLQGNYVFGVDAGTSDVAPYSGSSFGQYSQGIGGAYVGFGGGGAPGGGVVSGGGSQVITSGLIMDGTTWNTINVKLIQRSDPGYPVRGQIQLSLNGVNTGTWSTFTMGTGGLNIVDINSFDSNFGAQMGSISVTQAGIDTSGGGPAPTYMTLLPGGKGNSGGITTDGSRYIYVNSGPDAGNTLQRYDTVTHTWTTLAAMPTPSYPSISNGYALTPVGYTPHGLSIDNGKIVMLAGPPPNGFPNGCNAFVYDIASNTWAPAVMGNAGLGTTPPGDTYENIHAQESGGGFTYGITNSSQGGSTVFSLASNSFVSSQTVGAMPFNTNQGNPHWGDMAYVAASGSTPAYLYMIGANDPTTGMGELGRYDPVANTVQMMAELPVAMPTGDFSVNDSLTYVDAKHGDLLILHSDWNGNTGIYDQSVPGGFLYAVLNGSNVIYQYDIADNQWAPLDQTLPFTIMSGDDITAGLTVVPEPATMALLAVGAIGMVIRRRRK